MLPSTAQQLARLVARRRLQGAAAQSLDAYDRWGRNDAFEEKPELERLAAKAPVTVEEIRALTAHLQQTDPAALDAFIDGQLQLLDAFAASVAEDSVERSVAADERTAWEEVRRGERTTVHQNTYYVQQDAVLFEQIFGFSPDTPNA